MFPNYRRVQRKVNDMQMGKDDGREGGISFHLAFASRALLLLFWRGEEKKGAENEVFFFLARREVFSLWREAPH